MAKPKKNKSEQPALIAAVDGVVATEGAAPAAASAEAEASKDRGPSADKLARDIALKAAKFGGVEQLIGHYEFPPSRRVCKKAAEMLRDPDAGATEHADAVEAWSIKTYGVVAAPGSSLNNLRGRPMPVLGESREFSVQRIDTVVENEDGTPKLDEAGQKITTPGSCFIRLNLAPIDVLKGGSVEAKYNEDGTVTVRVVRREPEPEAAPVAADAPAVAAA